jgi:hypothetical protein
MFLRNVGSTSLHDIHEGHNIQQNENAISMFKFYYIDSMPTEGLTCECYICIYASAARDITEVWRGAGVSVGWKRCADLQRLRTCAGLYRMLKAGERTLALWMSGTSHRGGGRRRKKPWANQPCVPTLKTESSKENVVIRIFLPIWEAPRTNVCPARHAKVLHGLLRQTLFSAFK